MPVHATGGGPRAGAGVFAPRGSTGRAPSTTSLGLRWWSPRLGARRRGRLSPALPVTVGLFGLAFNCKQPLAIFALRRWLRWMTCVSSLAGERGVRSHDGRSCRGSGCHVAYHRRCVPAWVRSSPRPTCCGSMCRCGGSVADNVEGSVAAVVALSEPAAGIFWHCPAVVPGLAGLSRSDLADRRLRWAPAGRRDIRGVPLSMAFGAIPRGIRYLTPLFAVCGSAPMGASDGTSSVAWLLVAGLVQLRAEVDPHRLYVSGSPPPFSTGTPGYTSTRLSPMSPTGRGRYWPSPGAPSVPRLPRPRPGDLGLPIMDFPGGPQGHWKYRPLHSDRGGSASGSPAERP
jgi:hypothetical protein